MNVSSSLTASAIMTDATSGLQIQPAISLTRIAMCARAAMRYIGNAAKALINIA